MAERQGRIHLDGAEWVFRAEVGPTTKPMRVPVDQLPGINPEWNERKATAQFGPVRNAKGTVTGNGILRIAVAQNGDGYPPLPPPPEDTTAPVASAQRPPDSARRPPNASLARPAHQAGPAAAEAGPQFANSYNFVPGPHRQSRQAGMPDLLAIGHSRYGDGLYSGTIPVSITTMTPLLLPDQNRAKPRTILESQANSQGVPKDLQVLPVRCDPHGNPLLDGSAVKGMLRSAFEAVTGSRMGVFFDHDNPLSMRSSPTLAPDLRPAIVSQDDSGRPCMEVTTHLRHYQEPTTDPQPAVWVPLEKCGSASHPPAHRVGRARALHGKVAYAWIHLLRHRGQHGQADVDIWRAESVVLDIPQGTSPKDLLPPAGPTIQGNIEDPYKLEPLLVKGILHWTGAAFGHSKHDERLFVTEVLDPNYPNPELMSTLNLSVDLDDARGARTVRMWRGVIDSYESARIPGEPTTDFGLHIMDSKTWRALTPGRTLYAAIDAHGEVERVSPTLVGRDAYQMSPLDLARAQNFEPAATIDQLSDADWVFGWTSAKRGTDGGPAAHRGHLRVDAPKLTQAPVGGAIDDSVEIPLATLNSPKPAQYRFYTADTTGSPIQGQPKRYQDGFGADSQGNLHQLRGWKMYQYDRALCADRPGAAGYWSPPEGLITARHNNAITPTAVDIGGVRRYREYIASSGYKVKVSRGIKGWVRPGTVFTTTLRVDNLTARQIGALLWLLSLPDGMLRLGWAKPLGFGVVKLAADLESTRLLTGAQIRQRTVCLTAAPDAASTAELVRAFTADESSRAARSAFTAIANGIDGLPVHAPRKTIAPQQESFGWWVHNDHPHGPHRALPLATGDQGLPYPPQE